MNVLETYEWTCPACATTQTETVTEDGPFYTCTCEQCGHGFDRDALRTTDTTDATIRNLLKGNS